MNVIVASSFERFPVEGNVWDGKAKILCIVKSFGDSGSVPHDLIKKKVKKGKKGKKERDELGTLGMITFLGTQPTLTQVPPSALNSTTPTFAPYPFKYNSYYLEDKKK